MSHMVTTFFVHSSLGEHICFYIHYPALRLELMYMFLILFVVPFSIYMPVSLGRGF